MIDLFIEIAAACAVSFLGGFFVCTITKLPRRDDKGRFTK